MAIDRYRNNYIGGCTLRNKLRLNKNTARDLAAKVSKQNNDHLEPYKCRKCGYWHIGHPRVTKNVTPN